MFKKIKLWIASFFKEEKKEEIKEEVRPLATYHAKKRLEQRHGEVLTDDMVVSFIRDIKEGKAKFIRDTRNNTQEWIVSYSSKKYKVIYNRKSKIIVTIYSSVKKKRAKPTRKKRNKRLKRLHLYDASIKRERSKLKKPYKRNKRVEYSEII